MRLELSAAALLFVVGCGAPAGESPDPSSDDPVQTPTSSSTESTATSSGLFTGQIGCEFGPTFSASALTEPSFAAASEVVGLEAAMTGFLGSEEGQDWPQDGWLVLDETNTTLLLVHHGDEDAFSFMEFQRDRGEGWMWSGGQRGGSCDLFRTTPEGMNTVQVSVDPGADIQPDSTVIPLLLTEQECVSGRPMNDRLGEPELLITDRLVMVTFHATPPPGASFNCQGNPTMSYSLILDEPLGNRDVRDGRNLGMSLGEFLP